MEQESSMSFQKIVLVIAIIALILTISVIGYMMYYSAQSKPYPPSYPACPDMWGLTGTNVCTNTASPDGYFSNVGSFLTDISCSLTGQTNGCTGITNWADASFNWVQGNSANKLDASNNYLMASFGTASITRGGGGSYQIPNTISHTLVSSLSDNVNWAKAYGITWDGLN